jgi:LCP family protein required for cell wall assembly
MRGARHMADRRPPQDDSGAPRRRTGRGRRVLAWVLTAVAGLLVAGGGVAAVAAWRLQGNIRAVDISRDLGTRPTPAATATSAGRQTPLNVLVLGSDSREGANGFIGGTVSEGARSDTTLLLHLSADRTRALAVSIPRDSMVDMPSCTGLEGGQKPGGLRQFNDAYTIGGTACTQRTVEQLTGVRIDHYVVVDFAGFKGMVDALGTVPVCLPHAVNDTRHHIQLPAGRSRVDGTEALAYVRERYALGDGGDLGRIERQHAFIASVLQEAMSAGTLTNPPKLYAFLQAATRSVTMDPQLASLPTLAGLAKQVTDVGLGNIQFVTVPTEEYPPDPNRLQWAPGAAKLWRAVRKDSPVTFTAPGAATPTPTRTTRTPGTGSTSGSTSGSTAGAVDPAQVRLRVLNASGTPGAAAAAAAELREAGWNVIQIGDAGTTRATVTRIRYGSSALAEQRARALAAVLPGAQLVPDASAGSTLRVEVGTDWAGVSPASGASGTGGAGVTEPDPGQVVVPGVQSRTASADICG